MWRLLRKMSTISKGVYTISMRNAPVNFLNAKTANALISELDSLEKNKDCRAVVLTSSLPSIFSAGLDLSALYSTSSADLNIFWTAVQEIWIRLYSCRLPVIAAINGSAPAAGCLLAISADYR